MHFNDHSNLAGSHAFMSASNYHWINYDVEKLLQVYKNMQQAREGTELHELAKRLILKGIKLPNSPKTLNMYVNHAIGFKMTPEQILYYSPNAYGTADTISFRKELLRVHDYKSGVTPASMRQCEVYASLFCLEYKIKPGTIGMELRIYQDDAFEVYEPLVDDIAHIMDQIITFDKAIEKFKMEE